MTDPTTDSGALAACAAGCTPDELARHCTFFAALCHDLRSPLNALLLRVELADALFLRAGQAATEPWAASGAEKAAAAREYLAGIRRQARACDALLRGVIEVAHLATAAPVSDDPFDLADLLAELSDAVVPAARVKGITVRVVRCGVGTVRLCRASVRRVVGNLIDNAVKYAPGGVVEVAAGCCGGGPAVSVSDAGPGVAAADAERVFAPFVRGPRTGAEGAGLGLFSARRLARSLGGDLTVGPAPGGGACFRLWLPAAAVSTER